MLCIINSNGTKIVLKSTMKKIIPVIIILLITFGCKSVGQKSSIKRISIIELIANPNKYHKKKVEVQGYFTNEFEGTAIYVSKNDFQTSIFKNGVYLYYAKGAMQRFGIDPPFQGYMTIVGIYNKDKKGSYNFFSGGFEEVISMQRMYKRGGIKDEFNIE